MTPSTAAIEAASARLAVDSNLADRLYGELKEMHARERRIDPRHLAYLEADAAFNTTRATVNAVRAAERRSDDHHEEILLLEVERRHALHAERLAAAEAAAAHEFDKREVCAAASLASIRAGGAVGRPSRDATLVEACGTVRLRIEGLACQLGDGTDDDFGARLGDLENAAKSFTNSVALARRELRLRQSAARADAAVAARLAA